MNKYNKLNLDEFLIIIGLTILPFTELRVSFFGFGEIIFLFLFIRSFSKKNHQTIPRYNKVITRYWAIILSIFVLGFIYNLFFLHFLGSLEGFIFDFVSYLFILLIVYTLEKFINSNTIDLPKIIKHFFILSSTILSSLYLISFFYPSLFGYTLKVFDMFQPFVKNVHHIGMFLSPLFFLGLFILENSKGVLNKMVILIFLVLIYSMVQSTNAFKAIFGTNFGILSYVFFIIINAIGGKNKRVFFIFLACLLSIIFVFNIELIMKYLIQIFVEEDTGSARGNLYSYALNKVLDSPLVGYGPGQHIKLNGTYYDVHQTVLTVLLQGGLFAFIFYIMLLFQIIKKTIQRPSLFACFVAISVYLLGGDILRRLPVWIFLFFLYYMSSYQIKLKEKSHYLFNN